MGMYPAFKFFFFQFKHIIVRHLHYIPVTIVPWTLLPSASNKTSMLPWWEMKDTYWNRNDGYDTEESEKDKVVERHRRPWSSCRQTALTLMGARSQKKMVICYYKRTLLLLYSEGMLHPSKQKWSLTSQSKLHSSCLQLPYGKVPVQTTATSSSMRRVH